MSMMRFLVSWTMLIAASAAMAGEKPTKPQKPPQKGFASIKATDSQHVIRVTKPIHAKDYAGGFAKLVLEQYEYRVPAGDYSVRYRSYANGREWFLIPTERWIGDRQGGPTDMSETINGCPSRFTDYLAIDRQTLQIEPYSYEVAEHACSERGSKRQGGWEGPLVILDAGQAVIVDQATLEVEQRARQEADASTAAIAEQAEEALAPLKRRIGAKLCKKAEYMTYIGYTEAVSPDLDRIQVRVVAATYNSRTHSPVRDYRPEILWDAPINWRLCE